MSSDDVLGSRFSLLRGIIRNGLGGAPEQVQGFLTRVLGTIPVPPDEPALLPQDSLDECLSVARFGGYPALARSGFCLAGQYSQLADTDASRSFLECIARQRERPAHSQTELGGDAIALLGIADGLRAIGRPRPNLDSLEETWTWCHSLLEQHSGSDMRLSRVRLLAADLLDGQGRLGRYLARSDDLRAAALDLCLWRT